MTCGPFFKKILIFSVPLMLTGLLQLAYNTADVVVVGRFVGKEALAAVGSTTIVIYFVLCFVQGFTGGFMAWNASCSLTKLEELRPLYEALED